jgi:hypothetical protein
MDKCAVDDCRSPRHCRGYCSRHYRRFMRNGSPTAGRGFAGEQIAYLKGLVGTQVTECIAWPYGKHWNGYGRVKDGKISRGAHRVVCRLAHGIPPSGKHHAAHKCHNRACVNPNHLRWATPRENVMDSVAAGRRALGEKCHRARLSEKQVIEIRETDLPSAALARAYGVHRTTIHRIKTNKYWSHI